MELIWPDLIYTQHKNISIFFSMWLITWTSVAAEASQHLLKHLIGRKGKNIYIL
jgi:hypothetical protein